MSSDIDMQSGGGDNVFTRIVTSKGLDFISKYADLPLGEETIDPSSGVKILFKNSIMDRTDRYAYAEDKYGASDEKNLMSRLTDEQIFTSQEAKGYKSNNEVMFAVGIPVEQMRAFVVPNIELKKQLIESLHNQDIEKINGILLAEFIQTVTNNYDLIDTGNDRVPRSTVLSN